LRRAKSDTDIKSGNRSLEERRRLSFITFGDPQAKAGLSPGWAS
jgi:hypothetical protein